MTHKLSQVLLWRLSVDVIKVYNQIFSLRKIFLDNLQWASKGLKSRTEASLKKKFHQWTATSAIAQSFSLPFRMACSVDLGLTDPAPQLHKSITMINPLIYCMCPTGSVSLVECWLITCCFQFLGITNQTHVNICVHVFVWIYVSFLVDKYFRVE